MAEVNQTRQKNTSEPGGIPVSNIVLRFLTEQISD